MTFFFILKQNVPLNRTRPLTKLDQLIEDAKKKEKQLLPLDCTLKMCTIEEKNKYVQENINSKVFRRNFGLLNEALVEFPRKSVTFWGRNLYIVPSKEHDKIKIKVKEGVEKYRKKKKNEMEKKEDDKDLKNEIEAILQEHFNQEDNFH